MAIAEQPAHSLVLAHVAARRDRPGSHAPVLEAAGCSWLCNLRGELVGRAVAGLAMSTCGSLSNLYCATCGKVGLHAESVCVHCGTVYEYERVRVRETDMERDNARSRKRGAAKAGEARRKRTRGSGNGG